MFNYNKKILQANRKKLRNNLTPAEAALWELIKNKKLDGRKFRRQHSIGNFILDFYCPEEKLAIELDGEDHYWDEGIKRDKIKTAYIKSHGIEILRFENKLVFKDQEFVLNTIKNKFRDTTPLSSPQQRGLGAPPILGGELFVFL
jgi:very-short-patch-repair endonuclease